MYRESECPRSESRCLELRRSPITTPCKYKGVWSFRYFKGSITSYHLELITALLVALKSQTSLASGWKMGQNADLNHEKQTTARNLQITARQESRIDWAVVGRTIAAARRVSQSVREGWSVRGGGPGLSQKGSTAALRDRQTDRGTRLSRGLPSGLIHRSYLYLRAGGVPTHTAHTQVGRPTHEAPTRE